VFLRARCIFALNCVRLHKTAIEMIRPLNRWVFLAAGGIAGAVGATLFLGLHAILLVPIWFSLARAITTGAIAGAVVAHAFPVLDRQDVPRPSLMRGAVFGALLWLALLPPSIVELFLKLVFPGILEPIEVSLVVAALVFPAGGAAWLYRRTVGAVASGILAMIALFVLTGGPVGLEQVRRGAPLLASLLPLFIVAGVCLTLILRVFACAPGRLRARAV
jgi:hypothetical protein